MWDVASEQVITDFPKVYKGQVHLFRFLLFFLSFIENISFFIKVTSVSWNYDGSVCATASKDKALRVVDPRGSSVAAEVQAHTGAKGKLFIILYLYYLNLIILILIFVGWRAVWCGKLDRIATVGFTKGAERELMLWDARNLGKALNTTRLDVSPAAPLPFVCFKYKNDYILLFD